MSSTTSLSGQKHQKGYAKEFVPGNVSTKEIIHTFFKYTLRIDSLCLDIKVQGSFGKAPMTLGWADLDDIMMQFQTRWSLEFLGKPTRDWLWREQKQLTHLVWRSGGLMRWWEFYLQHQTFDISHLNEFTELYVTYFRTSAYTGRRRSSWTWPRARRRASTATTEPV